MVISAHKIVVDPKTFRAILMESTYPPYEKRRVDPSELAEWSEYNFRRELKRCGYPSSVITAYIKQENVQFAS